MRIIILVLTSVFLAWPVGAAEVERADKSAIEQTISDQLAAFAHDDGIGAYAFAAPNIRLFFPSAETFMAMVKQGYQPVYHNKSHVFSTLGADQFGHPLQRVIITASDGKRYEAVYTMERQPDSTWKIAGCTLIEIPSVNA